MGTIRVTQRALVERSMININRHLRKLTKLQDQLSTGWKVNSPSDDPIATRRAVDVTATTARYDQYLTNISSVGPQLSETSTSMSTVLDIVQRAKELTLQGGNATNSQLQLDQISMEVDQLLESVVVEANHTTNGRFIFGGSHTLSEAYTPTRDAAGNISAVTFNGNEDKTYTAIGDNVKVAVNESGARAFQSSVDLFEVLIAIRNDLRTGNYNNLETVRIEELESAQDQLLRSMAAVGAVQNRVERTRSNIEVFMVQLSEVKSDAIDADYADTILELNAASNAFRAGLDAASRAIQPSLLDYI